MSVTYRYLDSEDVLLLHATVIKLTTGSLGVRDVSVLKGCLERPKTALGGNDVFATVFTKAAAYLEGITRNHPFVDGNKRTAFLMAAHFLARNGYDLAPRPGDIEAFMVSVVIEKLDIEHIAKWLETHSHRT
jgi:death on curing protein